MKILSSLLLTSLFCFLFGCKATEPEMQLQPANLVITTEVSTNGSGKVTFKASADNATNYQFYFGDDKGEQSNDGNITHSYSISETYKVTVIAFSKDKLFVDKTIEVIVKVTISSLGYSTPLSYAGMTLAWQDEFEGNTLNSSNWVFETGGSGWGNHELQFYQEQNTMLENGLLIIKAKKESVSTNNYTSSRIITNGKHSFKYGRVDIRAKLPKGKGLWPALWMLGSNISTVGWPKCGEIDIMEMIGGTGNDSKVYGTVHWENAGSHAQYGGNKSLTDGKLFADEFHVFSIVWNATSITWYLDDVQYQVIDITPDGLSELRADAFFIFNLAVGGDWPGNPDGTAAFPQFMAVDYIRVFQ